MMVRKEIFVNCKCSYIKHLLYFSTFYNKDIKGWDEEDEKIIYLETFLDDYHYVWFPDMFSKYFWEDFNPDDRDFWNEWIERGVYKRIAIGLNYIFGKEEEKDGIFDCTIIDPDYNDDLIKFLDIIVGDKEMEDQTERTLDIFGNEYICRFIYQDGICTDCSEGPTEVVTEIQFKPEKNIFKRIVKGVKYIFYRTEETDSFEMDVKDALVLKNMLMRVNKDRRRVLNELEL